MVWLFEANLGASNASDDITIDFCVTVGSGDGGDSSVVLGAGVLMDTNTSPVGPTVFLFPGSSWL